MIIFIYHDPPYYHIDEHNIGMCENYDSLFVFNTFFYIMSTNVMTVWDCIVQSSETLLYPY